MLAIGYAKMASMTEQFISRKARVFDFDDILVGRERITRVSGLVFERLKPHKLPSLTLTDISQLDLNYDRVAIPISSLKERVSFEFHARRNVYHRVKEELERIATDGTDIYGNTGRSNKGEWVDMTDETLDKGKVRDYFKGIFYTPDGVRTTVSKAHVIQLLTEQYEQVEFDDDDPRTVLFIAQVFPNVRVNLVQHRSTGLLVSSRELDELPNLRRVAVFGN